MTERFERTEGRRAAVQVLYQTEFLKMPADQVLESGCVPDEAGLNDYARSLLLGYAAHASRIDSLISERSQNWAIDRMPIVDRELLRLTIYEMLFVDEVPVPVSINEAVEIAKEFGGDDSHRFVNGVLGRVARDLESGVVSLSATAGSASETPSVGVAENEPAENETAELGSAEPQVEEPAAEQPEVEKAEVDDPEVENPGEEHDVEGPAGADAVFGQEE